MIWSQPAVFAPPTRPKRSISLERLFARLAEMTLLGRRLLHPLRRSAGMSSSSALAAEAAPPSALRWAVLPWSFFIGENVLLSHNRASIIALCGGDEQSYHALYNALSTAACASLGFGYFFRVAGAPPLRHVSVAAVGGSFVLQAVGLAGLFQALPRAQLPLASEPAHGERAEPAAASEAGAAARQWVIRCPMDFKGESASPAVTSPDGLHGLHRVSRHPMLWSLAAVGLGGALAVPSAPQAVWLLGPAAMALLGGAHIDYRHRRGEGGTLSAETERVTSLLPFAAMAAGAQAEGALGSLQALARELKVENAVLGVLLAARWAVTRGR
mmetsp:Transcript_27248/g.87489  ORF Transcript_27248/g.87489 Transcript_27248/m.87489 type:complete len:328 (-) Transcript_27248:143-1126(-)